MHVHLDHAALERKLKGPEADRARRDLAEAIAEKARAKRIQVGGVDSGDADLIDLPVMVYDDGNVFLAHPAGEAVEAKYGVLVKAAAELGLEVKK